MHTGWHKARGQARPREDCRRNNRLKGRCAWFRGGAPYKQRWASVSTGGGWGCVAAYEQHYVPVQDGGGGGDNIRRDRERGGCGWVEFWGLGAKSEATWAWLRGLSVGEWAGSNFSSTMVSKRKRGLFTKCVMVALERMRVDPKDVEAYKLCLLLPRQVLQPVLRGINKVVAKIMKERNIHILRGEWEGLYLEALEDQRVMAEAGEERASGPGSFPWRRERLWADHVSGVRDALVEVRNHLAAGCAPEEVQKWLAGAWLVALLKHNPGVNVKVLRKLVTKVICKRGTTAFRSRFCGRRYDDEHDGLRAAQIGAAVKGGADLGVYLLQAALDRHPAWVFAKPEAPRGRWELDFIDVMGVQVGKAVGGEMLKKVEE
ncbi:hypothetical protein CYMTET_34163 [Cymbomonas tetramitiformis]|uniref:Uncharacterized protein n=1 Tax=Cymbomonas tetramitiformis TaxID=36881 RepID=A0AAE0KQG3_9CHLO|nr:hypothetical protein CYMTET_34163 [Cymbomonas tetramitiformis]